ncbi:MAG: glyoxalase [Planctomycetes bacterium]|nr:glyoxalase [Planctomycetota bacterium]
MHAHMILYVDDQRASAVFYEGVLERAPTLDVPGMTEFTLRDGCVLGLMPADGIVRLLGSALPAPTRGAAAAKAELYLVVDDARAFHERALRHGAYELDPLHPRDWGHDVAYSLDRDGHVLAFAQERAAGP